jgi:hypothetical protein
VKDLIGRLRCKRGAAKCVSNLIHEFVEHLSSVATVWVQGAADLLQCESVRSVPALSQMYVLCDDRLASYSTICEFVF